MRPELIEATRLLQEGGPRSIEVALSHLQGTVYAFSMKVCEHPQDAEDNMQEVLLRSLPHLRKITEPRALAVWLYTVTKNRCWRSRRKSVYAPGALLSLDDLMPERAELHNLLTRPSNNPEDGLLVQERDHTLQEAIFQLPTQYRLVLVLHDVEGLDTEQVASVLNLKEGTVRVRLHRARLFVRKALSPASEALSATAKPKLAPTKRPLECKELFANLSEYLDDRLPIASCAHMREHIEACPACVAFIDDLKRAIDRCRELQGVCDSSTPANLRTLLTQEYRRLMGTAHPEKSLRKL